VHRYSIDTQPVQSPLGIGHPHVKKLKRSKTFTASVVPLMATATFCLAGDFSSCSRKEDVGPFGNAADRGWCDTWHSYRHRTKLSGDALRLKADHDEFSGEMSRAVETRRIWAGRSSSRPDRIYIRSAQLMMKDVRLFEVDEPELFEHYGVVTDLHVDPSRAVDDDERMGVIDWR
jgi:hypothetical protein